MVFIKSLLIAQFLHFRALPDNKGRTKSNCLVEITGLGHSLGNPKGFHRVTLDDKLLAFSGSPRRQKADETCIRENQQTERSANLCSGTQRTQSSARKHIWTHLGWCRYTDLVAMQRHNDLIPGSANKNSRQLESYTLHLTPPAPLALILFVS